MSAAVRHADSEPVRADGASSVHLEVADVRRRYEGICALDGVSLTIQSGTVHALVGENGAGKSTLGKIIGGAVRPDSGQVSLRGRPVEFSGPREALAAGIALVHQEIALAPSLTVTENVFLGTEESRNGVLRRRKLRDRLLAMMEETGLPLDPDVRVDSLRVAEQQVVEILRALARDADLIVMDEPTAALSATEVARLKEIICSLRDRGKTIVYISHALEEVLEIADTVSVLKDGRLVETRPAAGTTADQLITAMLGRPLSAAFPAKRPPSAGARPVLEVEGLTRHGELDDICFTIGAGEIVGFAGLVGSGRTELARTIFGADRIDAGTVTLEGRRVRFRSPSAAVRAGVALLPEDRKQQGLVMNLGVRENLTLASLGTFARGGVMRRGAERAGARALSDLVDVRGGAIEQPVSRLSGGNQQKVAFGKWLQCRPSLFVVDEPTRGVDVGAKRAIYDLIRRLADDGMAVLLISSDLLEIQGLADRIIVMRAGRIVAEMSGAAAEGQILSAAFGRLEPTEET